MLTAVSVIFSHSFLITEGTPGLSIALLPTIDESRKLCEVRFDNVALPAVSVLGKKHDGWAPSRLVAAGRALPRRASLGRQRGSQ